MITIICIGFVTALAGFVIALKTCKRQRKKLQKWEKANIMKQLLALSERESGIAPVAPSRSRTTRAVPGMRPGELPRKVTNRISQPTPSAQGRC
jgi:hypothetical protein